MNDGMDTQNSSLVLFPSANGLNFVQCLPSVDFAFVCTNFQLSFHFCAKRHVRKMDSRIVRFSADARLPPKRYDIRPRL